MVTVTVTIFISINVMYVHVMYVYYVLLYGVLCTAPYCTCIIPYLYRAYVNTDVHICLSFI